MNAPSLATAPIQLECQRYSSPTALITLVAASLAAARKSRKSGGGGFLYPEG